MEKKVCASCFEEISGGVFIVKNKKKIYFCSGECLEEFEKLN